MSSLDFYLNLLPRRLCFWEIVRGKVLENIFRLFEFVM